MAEKAYIGFKDCGCPVAAMVAGYDSERSEKAELKRWVKSGYQIKVMSPRRAKALPNFLNCAHKDATHRATPADNIDALVARARA